MDDPARSLADAVEAALPGWVERSVARRLEAWCGEARPDFMAQAATAGARAAAEVGPEVRRLLALDIDEQRTNPLAVLRARAVRYPTEVLEAAGVPAVERDEHQARLFPDDRYDLAPARFADIDPGLADLGLAWGAWKAMEHRNRHRAVEGR